VSHTNPTDPSAVPLLDRRRWLRRAAAAGLLAALPPGCARYAPPPHDGGADEPLRFPGKVAMRALGDSPPNLETPWRYYRDDLTPNDAFFVRWHLQFLPTTIDLRTWRLKVSGHVERPLELSMDDLRRMPAASVVAVTQCAGNSRSLFEPPVQGGQWGNGAMGNARWAGVPLRDLLSRAGVRAGAVDVTFAGLDRGGYTPPADLNPAGTPAVPDFVKSLGAKHATDPAAGILVAFEMNGQPLPLLNGFPARLIVPGWYGTYWVKSLGEIAVLTQRFDGFWMSKGYRIPPAPNAVEQPDKLAPATVPIHRMNVRSFFVVPEPGERLARGQAHRLEGIAFDGGDGIRLVEVSTDGGGSWQAAELGDDLGNYSFRRWRLTWRPERAGMYRLRVRAVNGAGETQPDKAGWNRSGYMRNVVEEQLVEVV
jgi:DMSO/TMAO reductase YedYZ molybdopterin-dependent catalytic subunit